MKGEEFESGKNCYEALKKGMEGFRPHGKEDGWTVFEKLISTGLPEKDIMDLCAKNFPQSLPDKARNVFNLAIRYAVFQRDLDRRKN